MKCKYLPFTFCSNFHFHIVRIFNNHFYFWYDGLKKKDRNVIMFYFSWTQLINSPRHTSINVYTFRFCYIGLHIWNSWPTCNIPYFVLDVVRLFLFIFIFFVFVLVHFLFVNNVMTCYFLLVFSWLEMSVEILNSNCHQLILRCKIQTYTGENS